MGFGKRVTARSSVLAMIFTVVFAPLGCEKPKPTAGDQDVTQQTRDLRDELKKAVDDHLSSGANQ